ncbi:DUF1150 family protein [Marinivivus vitaminiproducens]|uniref:DUF1150 family protein n=1 Tax=Marinivivus vitaminiproducens TaxID=3035935 RepID=UPI0027AA98EB|nr:DUF1150 family protein [Geminicoccaceae bacterium SCSIO 64248]
MDQSPLAHVPTEQMLAAMGAPNIAYIKPVMANGQKAYAIHASDGSVLALAPSRPLAFAVARQNELEAVDTH